MPLMKEFQSLISREMELEDLSNFLPGALCKVVSELTSEVRYYDQLKSPFEVYKKYPGVHFIAPSQNHSSHHQIWIDRRCSDWQGILFHEVGHAVISDLGLPNFGWRHDTDKLTDERNELIVSDLCDMLQDIWVEQFLESIGIDREKRKLEMGRALLDDTFLMVVTDSGYSSSDVVRICKRYVDAKIEITEAKFCGSPLRNIYSLSNNRFQGKTNDEVVLKLAELKQNLLQPHDLRKFTNLFDIFRDALIYINKEGNLDSVFHLLANPEVAEKANRTYQNINADFKYNIATYKTVILNIAAILGTSRIINNE